MLSEFHRSRFDSHQVVWGGMRHARPIIVGSISYSESSCGCKDYCYHYSFHFSFHLVSVFSVLLFADEALGNESLVQLAALQLFRGNTLYFCGRSGLPHAKRAHRN